MSCTICGKKAGPGAMLCRPCKAALKRARQFTVLEIPGMAPAVTMPGGLAMLPVRPREAVRPRRARRAPMRALAAVILAALLATAGTLFAVARLRHADEARASAAPPPLASPVPREADAAPVEPAPLRIAPRTLLAQKPRVKPTVADAAPSLPAPAAEAPAVTASATIAEAPVAAPVATPAPPPDRWQTMGDALAHCAREGGLAGFICDQRTRLEACEGFWGRVAQCPLPPENPH